ncbi:MAG: hypothetical protein K0S39_5111 [Paenibacillus sp.]|jgi:hypothetical protein|nr:hypothetical protein [Paenibacillus sp.]
MKRYLRIFALRKKLVISLAGIILLTALAYVTYVKPQTPNPALTEGSGKEQSADTTKFAYRISSESDEEILTYFEASRYGVYGRDVPIGIPVQLDVEFTVDVDRKSAEARIGDEWKQLSYELQWSDDRSFSIRFIPAEANSGQSLWLNFNQTLSKSGIELKENPSLVIHPAKPKTFTVMQRPSGPIKELFTSLIDYRWTRTSPDGRWILAGEEVKIGEYDPKPYVSLLSIDGMLSKRFAPGEIYRPTWLSDSGSFLYSSEEQLMVYDINKEQGRVLQASPYRKKTDYGFRQTVSYDYHAPSGRIAMTAASHHSDGRLVADLYLFDSVLDQQPRKLEKGFEGYRCNHDPCTLGIRFMGKDTLYFTERELEHKSIDWNTMEKRVLFTQEQRFNGHYTHLEGSRFLHIFQSNRAAGGNTEWRLFDISTGKETPVNSPGHWGYVALRAGKDRYLVRSQDQGWFELDWEEAKLVAVPDIPKEALFSVEAVDNGYVFPVQK